MKSLSRMLLGSLIVVAVTSSVFAGIGDIDWLDRNTRATTHQDWSFATSANPAYPDYGNRSIFWNPNETEYNRVQAMITGEPTATWEHFDVYNGRYGVWFADSLDMRFHILNTDDNAYKDVVLRAVFQGNLEVPTVTAAARSIEVLADNVYDLEDGWQRLEQVWRIRPNPSEEWVCLGLEGTGGAIDYVRIDTICVPEPATILLLGLGGAVARLKKRRG